MGTRGAWGFRLHENDKVTYNHFDSYPDGLGKNIVTFVKNQKISDLKNIAENIKMVDEVKDTPTEEQIEKCERLGITNYDVSEQSEKDYYCLLRGSQGKPEYYAKDLAIMLDGREFLFDDLFCEFAYIINLDDNVLEFYFHRTDVNNGRYVSKNSEAISLCATFDFKTIKNQPVNKTIDQMVHWDKSSTSE